MTTLIKTKAKEGSTYIITCAFTDEDDNAVIPDSIVWSLTDADGTVINSREDVAVETPASSIDIVLSGDDLQILTTEEPSKSVGRRIIVEAVYESDAGSSLPLKDEAAFVLENLTKIGT